MMEYWNNIHRLSLSNVFVLHFKHLLQKSFQKNSKLNEDNKLGIFHEIQYIIRHTDSKVSFTSY